METVVKVEVSESGLRNDEMVVCGDCGLDGHVRELRDRVTI